MQYLQILLRIMRFSSVFSPGARHLRCFFRMREHLADIMRQQMQVVCRINQPSTPCVIRQRTPPTSDAMHGTPSSIASPSELGEFSMLDGSTNT